MSDKCNVKLCPLFVRSCTFSAWSLNNIFLTFLWHYLQDANNQSNAEISKREKERLKEMQQLKKQKIQEILDAQNAAIDADMVRASYRGLNTTLCYLQCVVQWVGSLMCSLLAEQ